MSKGTALRRGLQIYMKSVSENSLIAIRLTGFAMPCSILLDAH